MVDVGRIQGRLGEGQRSVKAGVRWSGLDCL